MRTSVFCFFASIAMFCVAPSLGFAQQAIEPPNPKSTIMNIGTGIRKQMRGLVVKEVSKDMKSESFNSPYIEKGRKDIQNFILGNGYIQRKMLNNISIIPDHLRQGMMEKSRKSPEKGMSGIRSIARDLLYNVTLYYVGNTQSQLRILQVMTEGSSTEGSTQTIAGERDNSENKNSPQIPQFTDYGNVKETKPSFEETQEKLEISQTVTNPFTTREKSYTEVEKF